ncbi:DUF1553 domain-containing protein [Portibacter marinus]|uniref:DUF1553 domain-containing protein n=1 Tax=Portibacter marinus TaxID=2898660 RepID=UPI001F1D55EB|nr:DUF1553 domain-containing protein [Portibacter marinus]
MTRYFLVCISLIMLSACSESVPENIKLELASLPDRIDYNIHVKPILSDRCYKCHGPDANQRKADFRIDIRKNATSTVLSEQSVASHSITAGNPGKSEVFLRMISDDIDYMMPPPESNLQLTDREKAIITKWIEEGAEYQEHWSFNPPSKNKIPKTKNETWPTQDIDFFILNKMEEHGINPSHQADKTTLLRRISLDITGLPPTVEEIEKFVKSSDPQVYEKTIDELLSRPEYGERMASIWLDAARYADTHGYQDDGLRNSWPWRTWVIDAFNDNMPYDQFLTEQLAGDLIPNATNAQVLATSFNRNHPQTQEGGVVEEEYRVEYVADRTNTYGKAILGLTMECARCHDHKYDPITQKDYYALSAYFNNNNDSGIVPYNGEAAPTVMLPTPHEKKQLDSLQSHISELEEQLVSENYKADLKTWLDEAGNEIEVEYGKVAQFDFEEALEVEKRKLNLDGEKSSGWAGIGNSGTTTAYVDSVSSKPDAAIFGDEASKPMIVEGYRGNGLQFLGDCGVRFNRRMDYDRYQPFSVSIWIKVLKEGEKGPIFNNTNGDFEGYRGWICKLNEDGTLNFQLNHVWPDNCIDYQTIDKVKVNEWTNIVMTYDGSSRADGLRFYIDGQVPDYFLHEDNLNKSLQHGRYGSNWSSFPFILGKEKERSTKNVAMDELMVFNRELSQVEVEKIAGARSMLSISDDKLVEYYLLSGKNERFNEVLAQITEVRKQENLISTDVLEVMVMGEKKEYRPAYILDRGMYDSPLEMVKPATPSKFKAIGASTDTSAISSRMDLAEWTVSSQNPLTSRVHVNRIWSMLFGKGLVSTQEDFGNQGNLPTHPKLLDHLAIDFMENGWDTKRLIRKILLSSTYQQSSVASEEHLKKDPGNQYYSRFPAHRLSAEMIRDHALASSGLLVDSLGGPSVYPYQPDGIWEALATRNATEYHQGSGEDLYRRSLYTIWKRSAPPPSMLNFDAPDRYLCTVNRQKTATPLQSLVLMNDPQYLEASKVLALTVHQKSTGNFDDQLDLLYIALVSREASQKEKEIMEGLYRDELKMYQNDKESARKLLDIGEFEIKVEDSIAEIASLTVVASTLMNYDEFVMKR